MSNQRKKKEKEYRYISITKCDECGTVPEKPEPCLNCKNTIFVRVLLIEEIK